MKFNVLPPEMIFTILAKLPLKDLLTMRLTDKFLKTSIDMMIGVTGYDFKNRIALYCLQKNQPNFISKQNLKNLLIEAYKTNNIDFLKLFYEEKLKYNPKISVYHKLILAFNCYCPLNIIELIVKTIKNQKAPGLNWLGIYLPKLIVQHNRQDIMKFLLEQESQHGIKPENAQRRLLKEICQADKVTLLEALLSLQGINEERRSERTHYLKNYVNSHQKDSSITQFLHKKYPNQFPAEDVAQTVIFNNTYRCI